MIIRPDAQRREAAGPSAELRPEQLLGAPSDRAASTTGAARACILIVEDDHLVAMQIEAALIDAGWAVAGIAATAEEAVALAEQEKPALAIMDIRLAGERDGIDAALELLERQGLRSIFATAHHDSATKLRAQPAQPLGWLVKPYHPRSLIDAVRGALAELGRL